MNLNYWLIAAAIAATPSASALAQDTPPPPPQPTSSSGSSSSGSYASDASRWLASGFVGSNFGNNAKPASMNIGGSIGYLWKNMFGAQLDTAFTPSFQLQNKFFGTGVKPDVNSFMANAIWAPAMGSDGRLQPFVSGGVGAISLRSGVGTSAAMSTQSSTRFGGDVGGGLMAFAGRWGFKAGLNYLRATGTYSTSGASSPTNQNPNTPPPTGPYGISTIGLGTSSTQPAASITAPPNAVTTTSLPAAALAGLHFWQFNVGVAVRW